MDIKFKDKLGRIINASEERILLLDESGNKKKLSKDEITNAIIQDGHLLIYKGLSAEMEIGIKGNEKLANQIVDAFGLKSEPLLKEEVPAVSPTQPKGSLAALIIPAAIILIALFIASKILFGGDKVNYPDFSVEAPTVENVTALADEMYNPTEVEAQVGTNEIVITYYLDSFLDHQSLVDKNARQSVKLIEQLYKNPNTDVVQIIEQIDFIDDKGNYFRDPAVTLTFTRDSVSGTDFNGMYELVRSDHYNIENIAEAYGMSPVIRRDLK